MSILVRPTAVAYACANMTPEPALVSARPWQGLGATASAERKPIRGVWGGARSGVPGGTAPGGGSGGFAELVLGTGGGGRLFDKLELQNDRAA